MAYFNNINDPSFYPVLPTSDEFGTYLSLGRMSANEEAYDQNPYPSTVGWMGGQPGYVVGPPTTLRGGASFGKDNHISSWIDALQ